MALSGVRSSWLMLARNCDLCLLASASSRLFSSISRNSLAFWIASTDWSAKVSRRSIVFLANSPGCLRRTTRMPTISPGRSSESLVFLLIEYLLIVSRKSVQVYTRLPILVHDSSNFLAMFFQDFIDDDNLLVTNINPSQICFILIHTLFPPPLQPLISI